MLINQLYKLRDDFRKILISNNTNPTNPKLKTLTDIKIGIKFGNKLNDVSRVRKLFIKDGLVPNDGEDLRACGDLEIDEIKRGGVKYIKDVLEKRCNLYASGKSFISFCKPIKDGATDATKAKCKGNGGTELDHSKCDIDHACTWGKESALANVKSCVKEWTGGAQGCYCNTDQACIKRASRRPRDWKKSDDDYLCFPKGYTGVKNGRCDNDHKCKAGSAKSEEYVCIIQKENHPVNIVQKA